MVVSGSADIATQGNHMSIDQKTDKLVINWNDFSIQTGQSVTFKQPGKTSVALNRVIGAYGSNILGQIKVNSQVFLVTPNGVVFGNKAQVNIGDLAVSARGIGDEQFNTGTYQFSGTSKGSSISCFTVNRKGEPGGLFVSSSGSLSNLKLSSLTVNGPTKTEAGNSVGGLVGKRTRRTQRCRFLLQQAVMGN